MLQRATPSAATEVLAGLVERVTFHNDENGFCVLRVKARGQRDLITVLGHAAMISAGEFVQASGSWINDRGGAFFIITDQIRDRCDAIGENTFENERHRIT